MAGLGEGKTMTWWKGFVCAVGLLFLLGAGCASTDVAALFALQSQTAGRDRVVSGSLEVVAQSAQSTLQNMGLAATMSRKGEAIYLASKTGKGAKFTLVLTREQSKNGEQTRVHMEWDGPSDEQTGFQLLGQLETLSRR
jgi:hypothetical protein